LGTIVPILGGPAFLWLLSRIQVGESRPLYYLCLPWEGVKYVWYFATAIWRWPVWFLHQIPLFGRLVPYWATEIGCGEAGCTWWNGQYNPDNYPGWTDADPYGTADAYGNPLSAAGGRLSDSFKREAIAAGGAVGEMAYTGISGAIYWVFSWIWWTVTLPIRLPWHALKWLFGYSTEVASRGAGMAGEQLLHAGRKMTPFKLLQPGETLNKGYTNKCQKPGGAWEQTYPNWTVKESWGSCYLYANKSSNNSSKGLTKEVSYKPGPNSYVGDHLDKTLTKMNNGTSVFGNFNMFGGPNVNYWKRQQLDCKKAGYADKDCPKQFFGMKNLPDNGG